MVGGPVVNFVGFGRRPGEVILCEGRDTKEGLLTVSETGLQS